MALISTLAVSELSEPTLWGIVVALSTVIAWGGRHVLKKLNDCESDRELLHRKVGHLASVCAAKIGEVINLDDVK